MTVVEAVTLLINAAGLVGIFLATKAWVKGQIDQALYPQSQVELDAEDVAMLKERNPDGSLVHSLCVFCAGWHIPPVTAAGCPRIKSCDINKNQSVTHVDYWEHWDKSTTIFPSQLPDPVVEVVAA